MKNFFVLLIVVLLIAFSIISCYYIYLAFINKKNNQININDIAKATVENGVNALLPAVAANGNEEKISPNATLVIKKHYAKCGHTTKKYLEIPKEFVNMNEQEIKKEFTSWELKGFSSNEIVMQKEEAGICDEHFILRNRDGLIAIYVEKENGEEELKEKTEISIDYLTQEDRKKLDKGIIAIGKEELNGALEDFE